MTNLSIQVELENDKDSSKLDQFNIKSGKGSSMSGNGSKAKKHHGTRKYDKINVDVYEDVPFTSGNPRVETVKGILHIYKESSDPSNRTDTLCLLSVPTVISCAEVVNFCVPFSNLISHIKILSSNSPGLYLTLIKFREKEFAEQFYETNRGKLINQDNAHSKCNLAFVSSVTYLSTKNGGFRGQLWQTELPTCPICLERMDESLDGILTVLCDHSFHAECLIKWPEIKCPICRHMQSPMSDSASKCTDCENVNDLWMCLICGNLGCGRYENKHAFRHFEDTAHTFSIKLGTSQVWDYAGDNYVHRLISSTDGKPVECANELQDSLDSKIESLKLEYNHLLTFQLSNQRDYYETKILDMTTKHEAELRSIKDKHAKAFERLQRESLAKLKSAKKADPKKLEEEKALNASLLSNQEVLKKELKISHDQCARLKSQYEQQIEDLQSQVNDLMKHLEIGQAIQGLDPKSKKDIAEGKIRLKKN